MMKRIAPAILALALLGGATAACSDKASPNDVRKEAKQRLIKDGFTEKQADCATKAMTDKQITQIVGDNAKAASADPDYVKRITKCLTGGK